MRRLLFAAIIALVAIPPAAAQYDEEKITDFASDIDVASNGALTVTETIAVVSTGEQLRHGIYRDFPTRYARNGMEERVRFDVAHVTLDGHDEPYDTESISDGVRVKIGSADTLISSGPHVFALTYITDRQIGFFDGFDELYWNVTGNGWAFPIEHASATIHLPQGARILKSAYYTGLLGATEHNAEADQISGHEIRFATTSPLAPHEGLTVATGFSKGAVLPPSASELRREFIADNAGVVVSLLGLAIVIVFYLVAWWHFGRDPRRGVIIPLFGAPENLPPAAVRFIHRMQYDRKAFAAALIDMAVKGYLTIAEDGGAYRLKRTGKSEVEADLSPGERAMAAALFRDARDTIKLAQANHTSIAKAISALKTQLSGQYERRYFVTNRGWFFGGLAILGLTGIAAALLSDNAPAAAFLLVWLSGWSAGTAFLLHNAALAWLGVFNGPGSRILNTIQAIFNSLFALPFTAALLFALFWFGRTVSPWSMAALVIGGAIAYLFYHLLKAPTLAGAPIRDKIDGFRLFLNATERDRLDAMNPPQITPAVFEKFLPYAIALDCENSWSKKFEAEAEHAAMSPGQTGYSPVWYSGTSYHSFASAGFGSSIGNSIASAAASSSVAPGSSSGSGGGGSSGGGGGGGGGGGW